MHTADMTCRPFVMDTAADDDVVEDFTMDSLGGDAFEDDE
jgi:hypothetical protein